LEVHILRPPFDQRFVNLVVGVLQIKQLHHQAGGQTGAARIRKGRCPFFALSVATR
jgi:sensor domain CHASE-containing protein